MLSWAFRPSENAGKEAILKIMSTIAATLALIMALAAPCRPASDTSLEQAFSDLRGSVGKSVETFRPSGDSAPVLIIEFGYESDLPGDSQTEDWASLKRKHHGSRMLEKFAQTPMVRPIAMSIPADTGMKLDRFEKTIEIWVQQGVRIINLSIGFEKKIWPGMEAFVDKHPEVAFVISAGSEDIEMSDHTNYPQKLAAKPNVIVAGLVRDQVGGSRGTKEDPSLIVHNYSSQGLVDVYCDFEGLCGSTSEAAVEYSKLLALLQFKMRPASPSGPELHRILLERLKVLPYARHYSGQRQTPPYPIRVYNSETYLQLIK